MLSCFSRVRIIAALWTVTHQTPLSWDSPGKNIGVGCYALLQGIFLTQGSNSHLLYWQMDSLPLSYLLNFYIEILKVDICISCKILCMLSCFNHVWLCATLGTVACQASLSNRQEYLSGLPLSSAGDLPDPGIKLPSLRPTALVGKFFTTSITWEAQYIICVWYTHTHTHKYIYIYI